MDESELGPRCELELHADLAAGALDAPDECVRRGLAQLVTLLRVTDGEQVDEDQHPCSMVKVVSSTKVRSRYRRVVVASAAGRIDQCPAASSSRRPNTDGLSKRGNESQSTEPAAVTSAALCRSDNNACSPIGT